MYGLPDEIVVTAVDDIRVITLNRPTELNAVNATLHRALADVWDLIARDPDARAVVLTGAGRAFSAGGDFDWMDATHTDQVQRNLVIDEARKIVMEMIRFPLPLIAAVNGPAVGLGCSLAILSDIVLISERAFMSDPHVSVGLVAGDGGFVWPVHTGLLRAKEYVMTGDRIPAELAVEFGLANRVIAPETLMDEALTLARRLAKMPAQALRDTKRALNQHLLKAIDGVMDVAMVAERESMGEAEHLEILVELRAKHEARASR